MLAAYPPVTAKSTIILIQQRDVAHAHTNSCGSYSGGKTEGQC